MLPIAFPMAIIMLELLKIWGFLPTARNYTVKYEKNGMEASQDNRGKRKPEHSLTELEKLRAELKLEKARREKAEMEASFLKKLNEIERRRG